MKRSLLLLFVIALLPVKTFSRQLNSKLGDEAVRQKAYKLLESLAEQIDSLQSGENRARMGSKPSLLTSALAMTGAPTRNTRLFFHER